MSETTTTRKIIRRGSFNELMMHLTPDQKAAAAREIFPTVWALIPVIYGAAERDNP